jgi:exonuclease III
MVVCLQETKLTGFSDTLINRILGVEYSHNFCFLPADGTRGGILLASRNSAYQFSNALLKDYTISTTVTDRRTNLQWTLTGVYGPQENLNKHLFLRELRAIKDAAKPNWLVLGDFNLICADHDKSNGRVDRRMMTHFRRALNHMEVREIPLVGK